MIVYWSPFLIDTEGFSLNFKEPKSSINSLSNLYKNVSNKTLTSNNFLKCASVVNYYKNVFCFSSPIDLTFEWTKKDFATFTYNQDFYDKFVHTRDLESGMISLECFRIILFAEQDLELELIPATLDNNDFVNNTILISGSFNIARWFRPIETAFFLKPHCLNKKIFIKEKDNLFYLKFKTDENIEFKKFFVTNDIKKIAMNTLSHKEFMSNKNLKNYMQHIYNYFSESNTRSYLLKLIKQNVME